MMQLAVPLILVNLAVLLAIGMIRQENPFDIWVLCLLVAADAIAFVAAAVITHQPSMSALNGLATNLLPIIFAASAAALLLLALTIGRRRQRPGS